MKSLKYFAAFFVITLPFIGFYLGFRYSQALVGQEKFEKSDPSNLTTPALVTPIINTRTYENTDCGFSLKYPQSIESDIVFF